MGTRRAQVVRRPRARAVAPHERVRFDLRTRRAALDGASAKYRARDLQLQARRKHECQGLRNAEHSRTEGKETLWCGRETDTGALQVLAFVLR